MSMSPSGRSGPLGPWRVRATVDEMWMTGSHPPATASPSTVSVAATLVAVTSAARRGSVVKTAARCTTASQPSSACLTTASSRTSPTTTSSAEMPCAMACDLTCGAKVPVTSSGRRTSSRTRCPDASSRTTTWDPTKPVPPVTITLTVPVSGGQAGRARAYRRTSPIVSSSHRHGHQPAAPPTSLVRQGDGNDDRSASARADGLPRRPSGRRARGHRRHPGDLGAGRPHHRRRGPLRQGRLHRHRTGPARAHRPHPRSSGPSFSS